MSSSLCPFGPNSWRVVAQPAQNNAPKIGYVCIKCQKVKIHPRYHQANTVKGQFGFWKASILTGFERTKLSFIVQNGAIFLLDGSECPIPAIIIFRLDGGPPPCSLPPYRESDNDVAGGGWGGDGR